MSARHPRQRSNRFRVFVGAALASACLLSAAALADGQPAAAVARAKALYDNAAYEEALAALRDVTSAEGYQYRALCLMALGRTNEAEDALESLVAVAPTFVPSELDVPPRLLSLLNQARSRVMPGVLRQLFADARGLFAAKEYDKAGAAFERLLEIANDPVLDDSEHAEDLRLLIAGFIDLVNATPITSAAAPAAPPPPVTASSTSAAAAAPEIAPALPGTPPEVIPAVTIKQEIPAWTGRARRGAEPLSAILRITIGEDGKVTNVAIEKSADPTYDARLLLAARSWLYEPALLRGKPVVSSKTIEVTVTPD